MKLGEIPLTRQNYLAMAYPERLSKQWSAGLPHLR
jgi:hypothetical protein